MDKPIFKILEFLKYIIIMLIFVAVIQERNDTPKTLVALSVVEEKDDVCKIQESEYSDSFEEEDVDIPHEKEKQYESENFQETTQHDDETKDFDQELIPKIMEEIQANFNEDDSLIGS